MDRVGRPIPSGTVTFLFSDIEGSTQRWERDSAAMHTALRRHDELLHGVVARYGGHVFKTVGDEFCTVFTLPADALAAALGIQLAIRNEDWSEVGGLRVRMGVHTGTSDERNGDYYGRAVNRVARLMAAGHGAQVLVSAATAEIARAALPPGCGLLSLGAHRLKDLTDPETIYQLTHPDLEAEFPAPRTLDARPNNLPLQVSSFIGRDAELAQAEGQLSKTRVLTLAGSGGVGKTRIAIQLAANVLDDYADGVWFVDLSSLRDAAFVSTSVLAALALREDAGTTATVTLLSHLKTKNALLILDNCEQLIEECAKLADALQRGCPQLRVIATSREALGIAGESVYRLPAVAEEEAVQIFSARAEAVAPTFVLTDENLPAVKQLCRRLDCVPMAIELAAARISILTPAQLLKHLGDRFRLLTGGSRVADARRQTLRGLIQWSFDLLAEPEKAMLRRLSVFASDWPLEAAIAVCAGAPIEEWDILDILTKLVDKSLINAEPGEGEHRYRLLESTREYALERLAEAGETEATFARHAAFWRDLARSLYEARDTPAWTVQDERLRRNYANVRAALTWAITQERDISLGSELATSLRRFWYWHGMMREGRYWFEELLRRFTDPDSTQRARALQGLATMDLTGDVHAKWEEALAIFERAGEFATAAQIRHNLALGLHLRGDFDAARLQYETSLADSRRFGESDPPITLACLGRLHWDQRMDSTESIRLLTQAQRIARASAQLNPLGWTLLLLARIAIDRGEWAEADEQLTESIDVFSQLGDGTHEALARSHRAYLKMQGHDFEGARKDLRVALDFLTSEPENYSLAECIDTCVSFAAAVGQWDSGARLSGFADTFCASTLITRALQRVKFLQAAQSALRGALGDAAFEGKHAEGGMLDVQEAIRLARVL